MDPLFASEVAHAVVGMSRKEANEIVNALLEKYEDQLRNPPLGQKYQECYDVVTGKPNKEFIELYREVRREMTNQFGLRFPCISPYL
jgi:methylamine--corrinoid protein Co-methyltransferase